MQSEEESNNSCVLVKSYWRFPSTYCHVTSRKSSLIHPSSTETGINPAELNSSSHSVTSPIYHLSITRELSSRTPITPLPFFPLPAAVPLWPSHSHALGSTPECNCTSNKQLFSELYSQPPFPILCILSEAVVQNTQTELLQPVFFFYTLCRLSPQHDAFLIGFLNADNQAANNKRFPPFLPPPFQIFFHKVKLLQSFDVSLHLTQRNTVYTANNCKIHTAWTLKTVTFITGYSLVLACHSVRSTTNFTLTSHKKKTIWTWIEQKILGCWALNQ